MKRLIYQVYVGQKNNLYDFCVDSVEKYCERYGIDHYVQTVPKLRIAPDPFLTHREGKTGGWKKLGYLPIFEKENAFDRFDQYDQIAIVDADIFIRGTAPNLFEEIADTDFDMGLCCEREMPITREYIAKIQNYSRMQYTELKDVDWKWNDRGGEFYNMGMMLMNKSLTKHLKGQSARQFLNRFEFKRFIDGIGTWKWSTDQTLLNWWVKKEKIKVKHLSWKFDALYTAVEKEEMINAHFVHFFLRDKLPERGENMAALLAEIGEV